MATKQTALEWLIEEMLYRLDIRIENTIDGVKLLEEAKAMEKEQIIDAVDYGTEKFGDISEQYYNETYGKQE